MDPQRYVVVNDATGIIENVVMWDGEAAWSPPQGCSAHLFPSGDVESGWAWNNGTPQPAPSSP